MSRRIRTPLFGLWFACLFALLPPATARAGSADEPLHTRIDRLIEAEHIGSVSKTASDAEFLRRVYLDLTGTIPSATDARAFLDDASPDKRTTLVDRLLGSPRYVRHMADVLDVMLMERRGDKHVKADEWRKYLFDSMAVNKPYDQLAREILGADGVDAKLRPAAKFYLDREGEVNILTRDVGRMFFGRDLQCAQCHDHPLIDDYLQSEYYGLLAFLNRSYVLADKKLKKSVFAEKAEGDVAFKSVFTDESGKTGPRLPGGKELVEPTFKKGESYEVKPAGDMRPVPKYSRRAQLAKYATDGTSEAFNRNIANRLWSHMMGRGLVEPADLQHPDNPSVHPAVSKLLADELVAMKFDVKAFLRELALSKTYQRSVEMPDSLVQAGEAAAEQLAALAQQYERLTTAADAAEDAFEEADSRLDEVNEKLAPAIETLDKASAAHAEVDKADDAAALALANAKNELGTKQDAAAALVVAAEKANEAAEKLPAEKDLKAAAEKFKVRAEQLVGEVPALEKKIQEQDVAAKAAAEKLAVAQQARQEATAQLDKEEEQVHLQDIQQRHDQAYARLRAEQMAATHAEQRIADAKALIDYGKLLASANASRQAADKIGAEFAQVKQDAEKFQAELPKQTAELIAAQNARDEAAGQIAKTQQQLEAKQQVVAVFAPVAEQAQLVQKKLPKDKELEATAKTLKARSDQLKGELDGIQKALTTRQAEAKSAGEQLAQLQTAIDTATTQLAAIEEKLPSLQTQLEPATQKAGDDQAALDTAFDELAQNWTSRFAVAALKPLTPEQMTWSIMQSLGLVDQQRAAADAELKKKAAEADAEKSKPKTPAELAAQLEQAVNDKLKGNVATYVRLFGGGAGQPQKNFFATVDQALFFANSEQVRKWLAPGGGNLTERLAKHENPSALTEEVYLSVLSRRPTLDELAEMKRYLEERSGERAAAIQELVWALLTTTEFRFNH